MQKGLSKRQRPERALVAVQRGVYATSERQVLFYGHQGSQEQHPPEIPDAAGRRFGELSVSWLSKEFASYSST